MNKKAKLIGLSAMIIAVAMCAYAQTASVGRWNLGEQDPGAAAGNPGNSETIDAVGTNDLASFGAPYYSSNTPAGTGSSLSMSFDGASCYQGSLLNNDGFGLLYSNLDFNNFSLSCDVYIRAPGSAGFSFPVSMGDDRNGGIGIVEIGGHWELIEMNVAETSGGPAIQTNAWTHLDLVRKPYGSNGVETRLVINGVDSGLSITAPPHIPQDFLTIGANELSSDIPGDGEGYLNGLVDNVVISNLDIGAAPSLASFSVAPGTIYAGNSIILTAGGTTGDPTSRNFAWRLNGTVVTNTTSASVTLNNVTTNQSGNYDVIFSNAYGSVTSAVVNVTVQTSSGADVAVWHMGEDDPGASAGSPGDATTIDSIGSAGLSAFGDPFYSGNVPAGGSTLSMSFDGNSYYEGGTNVVGDLYSNLDFNNFSLSCDVYVTAFGGAGFSFPVSMGMDGPGGFSIVEIAGQWHVLSQSVGQSSGVPAVLNQWTHLELQRREFGGQVQSRLFINGVDVNASVTAGPSLPIPPILTVGGNMTSDGVTPEGLFNGQIDNVVIHDYSVGQPPQISGLSASPLNIVSSGGSFQLFARGIGGQLPLNYTWYVNGTALTNTLLPSLTLNDVTTNQSGDYHLVISNSVGSITSSAVTITVLPPGESVGTTVAEYPLGEGDAGAASGQPGEATTMDMIGTNSLAKFGTPYYTNNTPGGSSTLAMSFNGTNSYYQASGTGISNLYSGLDLNNCSLSCDVYMRAPGTGGFSFPVSVGGSGPNGGGFALVEIGGRWEIINHLIEETSSGPIIPTNTWQHLEVVRRNFGSGVQTRLFINGVDAGLALTSAPLPPMAFFTVGANENVNATGGIEGSFNGLVDNVVLKSYNLVPPSLSLRMVGNQANVVCVERPRTTFTLWRTLALSPADWTKVVSSETDATGQGVVTDPNPPSNGAFYRVAMP